MGRPKSDTVVQFPKSDPPDLRDLRNRDAGSIQNLSPGLIQKSPAKSKPYELRDAKTPGLLLRVQPSGKKSFIVVYTVKGRKTRKTLGDAGLKTLRKARLEAKEIRVLADKDIDVNQLEREQKANTLGGYMEEDYTKYAEKYIIAHKDQLARIKRNFGHLYDKPLSDITDKDIDRWANKRTTKFKTTKKEFDYLKSVLNVAHRKHKLPRHPLCSYKLEEPAQSVEEMEQEGAHENIRFLSYEEETRLRDALKARETRIREERTSGNQWRNARHKAALPDIKPEHYADHVQPIILLALTTGLRRSDLFTLKWSNVNFDLQHIRKIISKTRRKKKEFTTLEVCGEATDILRCWRQTCKANGTPCDGNQLVFESPITGEKLDNINKAFRAILKDAEITGFRFHDLRHTFASRLVQGGESLYTVQELLAHSDPKTTQIYAHLAPSDKRAALDRVFGVAQK